MTGTAAAKTKTNIQRRFMAFLLFLNSTTAHCCPRLHRSAGWALNRRANHSGDRGFNQETDGPSDVKNRRQGLDRIHDQVRRGKQQSNPPAVTRALPDPAILIPFGEDVTK